MARQLSIPARGIAWTFESGGFGEGDESVESGVCRGIEAAGFQESGEQAFAGPPPGFELGLNSGECEFRKVQFEGFDHADQNRSSLCTAKCFAGAARAAILSGAAERSFGFVVGAGGCGVQDKREQFIVAHQPDNLVDEILELVIGGIRRHHDGAIRVFRIAARHAKVREFVHQFAHAC